MKNCKICAAKTTSVFNINFKAVSICESCASLIFIQQAKWYVNPPTTNKITQKQTK